MRKLFPSEKLVLRCLIFPESYHVILEETGSNIGALRDDLINLINYRLIEVIDENNAKQVGTSFYDTDNLQDLTFRATKTGLKHIREIA
ncbi:MAG: hypothetical protein BalsKO_06480 [Balneolaceae bacterium]